MVGRMYKSTQILKPSKKKIRLFSIRRCSLLLLVAGTSGLLFACSYGPTPFTVNERMEILAADRLALFAQQKVVDKPISLFEAMARALKYNLEHRVALLEKALAQKQMDMSLFDLLPQVTANAALKARGTPEASSGFSITDGTASNSYSTAQDRSKKTANLTVVWNVLDFGVSAIQARQESDRLLIAQENRRKAVHTLLQEVRSTFWRAAGAQKLEDAIGPVIQQARQALIDARQVERERLKPQLEILRFQKALLEIVRQLQDLRNQLRLAKTEFASLINLPPGSHFTLDIPDDPALAIPTINMSIEEMEQLALDNRPELREAMYISRISRGDVRKAMLRLLPGLEFQVSHNWDSNSFSLFSQWEEAGARVVWNILNILQGPAAIRIAENKEGLANMRRLTQHMAILTQVHLSYRQYLDDQHKLQAAEEIDAVDRRILKNSNVTSSNDAQSSLEHISSAASSIMSRLQLYQTYADAQNAVGRIFVTLGVDLLPKSVRSDEVSVLAKALREATADWNEGVSSTVFREILDNIPPLEEKQVGFPNLIKLAIEEEEQNRVWEEEIPSNYFLEAKFFANPEELAEKSAISNEEIQKTRTDVPKKEAEHAVPKAVTHPKEPLKVPEKPAQGDPKEAGNTNEEPKFSDEVRSRVQAWAAAWSQRDIEGYLAFYDDKNFLPPQGQSLENWRERVRNSLKALGFLQIDVSEIKVEKAENIGTSGDLPPGKIPTHFLQVLFRESYRSNHLHTISQKRLVLGKTEDGWKIYKEETRDLPQSQIAVGKSDSVNNKNQENEQ